MLKKITAKELLERLSSNIISFQAKKTNLERNSLTMVIERFTDTNINLAELFHENSKMSKYNIEEMIYQKLDNIISFKEETVLANYNSPLKQLNMVCSTQSSDSVPRYLVDLSNFLNSFNDESNMLYSCELRILLKTGQLLWFDVGKKKLFIIKNLSQSQTRDLKAALSFEDSDTFNEFEFCIFVVGIFARNTILYGLRGYRNTLIEAGIIAQYIIQNVKKMGYMHNITTQFLDNNIDSILECDGTEKSTLIIISVA